MSFRSRELMNKMIGKAGGQNFAPGMKEKVNKLIPNSKVVMGRAKRGIFAGRHIQFGNRISEEGRNKSRRSWKPNVQTKRLFSYILDRHIRVKVTTHALRCIDKAGGIDEYLLKTPYHKMDTELGLNWKAAIEKMYEELKKMVVAPSPEDEGEQKLEEEGLDRAARGESGSSISCKEGFSGFGGDDDGLGKQKSSPDDHDWLKDNSSSSVWDS